MKPAEYLLSLNVTSNPTDICNTNLSTFRKLGLYLPEHPSDLSEEEKRFPTNFEGLTTQQIMDKVAVFTSMYSYTSMLESAANVEVSGYKKELDMLEAKEYLLSDASNVTTKKSERDVAASVIEMKDKLQVAEARYVMLKSLRESYDKYVFVLSRALTVMFEESKR